MICTNYNVMMADGGGRVSSAPSAGQAASSRAAASGSDPRDASNINSFDSLGADFDMEGDLNALYDQKAQAESELADLQSQKDDAQSQISDRKQQLIDKKQSGEGSKAEKEQLETVKNAYNQTKAARTQAQQELNQLKQESSSNNQAINSNAQQTSQVSSQISSLQGQLASLTPPTKPSGEDQEGEGNYQAQLSAYNEQKNSLQSQIAQLQQQLQQLQNEAQQLQNYKTQLDREQSTKQMEVSQLEASVQTLQQAVDAYQQEKVDNDPELSRQVENDSQLQSLQSKCEQIESQISAKQSEIGQIDGQISAAEAKNSGLQAARAEDAQQDFQDAAVDMGFDMEDAETTAQSIAAREEYGKRYSELTDEEKMSLETRVNGEVTLAAMERAKEILKDDPDNAAAQAVVEKGAKNLEAQEELTRANLYGSLDDMPDALKDGAAAAMAEARANAPEGTDPEIAAMSALSDYLAKNADEDELSDAELAALDGIMGAAGDYIDSRECSADGVKVMQEAAESMANSELAAMKAQVAAKMGVSPDQLIVLSGTEGEDDIHVKPGPDGGLIVNVNGQEIPYTAEEAKYLVIDGGKGDDWITVDRRVSQDINIFGGAGNDFVKGGAGNDMIFGGSGDDEIEGGEGNDFILGGAGTDWIYAGAGSDVVDGGEGDDYLFGEDGDDLVLGSGGDDYIDGGKGNDVLDGGEGNDKLYGRDGADTITGGDGNDYMEGVDGEDVLDGGDGEDEIWGGRDADLILGGAGKDKIRGEGGDDYIFGGAGDDDVDGGRGDDMIFGEAGNDTIKGGDGNDFISGGLGADTIKGESGDDLISGGDGSDNIEGNGGSDTIYGEGGHDTIKGGDGDDCIAGGDGNDKIEGNNGKDILYGNAGDDDMNGGHGNDTLYGGDGVDTLDGGSWFRSDNLYWSKDDEPAYSLKPGEFDGSVGELGGDFDSVLDYAKDATEDLAGANAVANGLSIVANGMMAYSDIREGLRDGDAFQVAGGVSAGLEGAGSAASTAVYLGEKLHMSGAKLEKLNALSNRFGFASGILSGVSGTADLVSNIQDGDAHGAVDAAYTIADGVKSTAGAISNLYSGTNKVLCSMGTVARVAGGVGGALSVISGIMEAYEGWEDGNTAHIASGVFRTISGGTAIAAACCPAAAPVLLAVSGICALIDVGIGWIWG